MNLCIIYDDHCPKLMGGHYSSTYYDMFSALCEKFDYVQYITQSCSAEDIVADVIVIWDIHSAHHIYIEGLKDHKAVKYTYFNDPYQEGIEGVYRDTQVYVCKLGAKQRTQRALKRGVDFIICPYTEQYYEFIAPHLKDPDKMLVWFPPAPSIKRFEKRLRLLSERKNEVLANGITWGGDGSYDFRKWAYVQGDVKFITHASYNKNVPQGQSYGDLLSMYAGSLALCDHRIVPKYLEIPLAGCVCFAQYQKDYERMGFKDNESCIYVTKDNFSVMVKQFKQDVTVYQQIADNGRKLIEDNWTAEKFADFLYQHAKEQLC